MLCFFNDFFLCCPTDRASIGFFSCLSTSSSLGNFSSIPCMFVSYRNFCSCFHKFAAIFTILIASITFVFTSCLFVIFQYNISMILSIGASNLDCFICTYFITIITLNIMYCRRCASCFVFYFSGIFVCKGMSIWFPNFLCIFCYFITRITKKIIFCRCRTGCFFCNLV